jgi:hypothetical protein
MQQQDKLLQLASMDMKILMPRIVTYTGTATRLLNLVRDRGLDPSAGDL